MPTRALSLATVIGSDGALNLADVAGLHTVAGTGSYTDLINKPTIPSSALTFTGDASGSGTTGTTTSLTLANSGVSAGSYGSATNIPAITVDSKGRITSVTNTAVSIPSGSLTFTGDVTGSGTTGSSTSLTLANSGVTAGSYGSATNIPAITVDSKGRITSVTNTAVSIPSGSLTFTGDVTGSGTTGSSTSLTLASVGTAGTYTKVTTDAKGRVTSGTTLASSDLPTYTGTLTSSQVTTALGFTPYNSTNPSGYITGYTETDTLATVTGRGATTSTAVTLTYSIGDGTAALRLSPTSSSGSFQWASTSLSSGLGSGQTMIHLLGNATGTNNSGYVGYQYGGSAGSTNSFVSLGLYGNDNILRVYGGTYTQSLGSMRAPIFYDSNDTSYYLDPNSTGTSLQIAGTIEQGNNYAHPNIEWSASGTSTGEVIFYLPGTTSNYGMVHMVFDIYEYNSPRLCTVIVGGHNWGMSWYNTACNVVGYTDKQVRLGVKDGRYVVVFGTTGSSWSYGQIRLRKIQNGSYYNNIMDLGGNWSATQTTTESFSTITGDLRGFRTPSTMEVDGNLYAYTDVRSPIYYDYNDTGYYVNPRSASRLSGLRLDGVDNEASGTDAILWINKPNNNDWAMIVSGNLDFGINLGMAASHTYAIRAQANGTEYSRLGTDLFYHNSNIRAPIFYDSDNTGYYADLSSTGDSIRAAGNIIAYYSDDRLKTKLGNITDALKKVNQLNGFYYQANELAQSLGYKPTMEVGVSAQEVEQILPQIVKPAPIDQQYKTVDYSRLVPLLIEAVKELSQKLSKLEAKYGITS